MPDAPDKPLDPAAIAREKQARKNSKPYNGRHPFATVWDFTHTRGTPTGYDTQRRIDKECEEMKGGFREWVPEQAGKPAHWLVKNGEQWEEEAPEYI